MPVTIKIKRFGTMPEKCDSYPSVFCKRRYYYVNSQLVHSLSASRPIHGPPLPQASVIPPCASVPRRRWTRFLHAYDPIYLSSFPRPRPLSGRTPSGSSSVQHSRCLPPRAPIFAPTLPLRLRPVRLILSSSSSSSSSTSSSGRRRRRTIRHFIFPIGNEEGMGI